MKTRFRSAVSWGVAGLACAGAYFGGASEAEAAPSPSKTIGGGGGSRGGNTGIGLSLGDPMGLSIKHFMSNNHAIQFHLAWLPLHHWGGAVEFAYLWHPFAFTRTPDFDLVFYVGIEIGILFGVNYVGLEAYPPVGFGFHFKKAPIDLMLEGMWSPVWIYGGRGWGPDIQLAAGDVSVKFRYYF